MHFSIILCTCCQSKGVKGRSHDGESHHNKVHLPEFAAEHLFQADCLSTQLQFIGLVFFWRPPFVFHRKWKPKPFLSVERNAAWVLVKLHYIAFPRNSQRGGGHRKPSKNQCIFPSLPNAFVMGPLVHQVTFYSSQIILPLLLDVDQCPLTATEGKVLYARESEIFLLIVPHPIRTQLTPSGRAASSTLTT